MCGVLAEFERAIIQERVNAGLARAREKGTKSGKPIGCPRTEPEVEDRIRSALAAGNGIRRVATQVGVRSGTVQRIKAEMGVAA